MMQNITNETAWITLFYLTEDLIGEFWEKELKSKTHPEYTLKLEAGLAVSLGRLIQITELHEDEYGVQGVQTEMVVLRVERLDAHGVIYASFFPASLRQYDIGYPRQSLIFSEGASYGYRDICGWVPSLQRSQNEYCCKWMKSILGKYDIHPSLVSELEKDGKKKKGGI